MNNLEKLESVLESLGGEKRIRYTLDHFKSALKSVGNPEQNVKSLLIGGTNGKGTTTLLISHALKASGLKVSTYLSPHLQSPAERILNQLEPIPEKALLELAIEFEQTAKQFELTYFEYLTLLFFVHAKRTQSDYSVVEVGLGGRLDSTNVFDPVASILTNVSLDHQAFLGDTKEAILNEKLGILRPSGLLFTGIVEPELKNKVETKCLELRANCYFSENLKSKCLKTCWDGQEAVIDGFSFFLTNPSPGTLVNAKLAFLSLRTLFPSMPISTLQTAFQDTKTPGRFETVSLNPRVVLSGDHNLAGIECLKETLKSSKSGRLLTICGFSPDKPFTEMYAELKAISDEIVLTQISRLKDKTTTSYRDLGYFEEDPTKAVQKLLALARPEDTVLVTGSLYLVGELRKLWKEKVSFQ